MSVEVAIAVVIIIIIIIVAIAVGFNSNNNANRRGVLVAGGPQGVVAAAGLPNGGVIVVEKEKDKHGRRNHC